ncbi:CPBP family intramembrane metalloprotease [Paraburkholderia sp. Tr-20389]|uniref:CPBP family intramembrane glutamic endopeptidase n=1 Tax=Paraburkholderia sp. Tr-20389 TaxID=2703903 RepID=UPI00197DB77D|nr:type II CAAX endopeptidase family protein [Paraburkholderia sp. Tr-20389]MBN3756755.1 CPBP family intramembrane metalloprotease [Paraburkholderia sp. Tr-20389]
MKPLRKYLLAWGAVLICQLCHAGDTLPTPDLLHSADRASELVSTQQQAAYKKVLDAYEAAQKQRPDDAALAIARCTFIQHYAWAEDLAWTDVASKDLDACRTRLEKQFPSNADALLFNLEQRFGKDATSVGEPLVARSAGWSTAQKARLHASLSRAYAMQKDDRRAGEEAVIAAHLDPASPQLIDAVRFLGTHGKVKEGVALLSASPVPKMAWQASRRINVAVDALTPAAALDELRRTDEAGLKIDTYTRARALQHAGNSTAAQSVLSADKAPIKNETPPLRQLRLDVAFDTHDANAAAAVIADEYSRTHNATRLASAYAHLLSLSPAAAFTRDLLPLAFSCLMTVAIIACLPGLLMFPVHYRGVVRLRKGEVSEPLFAGIGLRHAWYALSLFSVVLWLVMSFHSGTALIAQVKDKVGRVGWQSDLVIAYVWTLLFAAAGLAWIMRRIAWRGLWGRGAWQLKWMLPAAAVLSINVLRWATASHAPHVADTSVVSFAQSIVIGAKAMGSLPLAVAILCVAVPIIEELVFRGGLLGGLSRHLGFRWSNVIQAVVFASMHQDLRAFAYLFLLALVAGWLAKKTKGLAMPMLLHAVNNAIFVATVA